MSRDDQPVPAVVALAADEHRAPAVAATEQIQACARGGGPRALHQDGRGRSARLRRAIQRARLVGGQQRLHPSVTAIANATALVFSCVNVINTLVMPNMSARRFAWPASAMIGA